MSLERATRKVWTLILFVVGLAVLVTVILLCVQFFRLAF